MKTKRMNNNIGTGLSRSAFEDDGIPNSPFKSSRSAAFTLAIFGILLGGLFVVCGVVMAFSHPQKSAPVKTVQQVEAETPAALQVAVVDSTRVRRHLDPAHSAGKHLKKDAKPRLVTHAK